MSILTADLPYIFANFGPQFPENRSGETAVVEGGFFADLMTKGQILPHTTNAQNKHHAKGLCK
jgi:hypothetical protein